MSYTLEYPVTTPTIDDQGDVQHPGCTITHAKLESESIADSLANTLGLPYYCVEYDEDHTKRVLLAYFPNHNLIGVV